MLIKYDNNNSDNNSIDCVFNNKLKYIIDEINGNNCGGENETLSNPTAITTLVNISNKISSPIITRYCNSNGIINNINNEQYQL